MDGYKHKISPKRQQANRVEGKLQSVIYIIQFNYFNQLYI